MMFFYSFGMFVPLFVLSYFYDKYHLEKKKWLSGKEYTLKISGKKYTFHTTNILSGILFIGFGIMFFLTKGTSEVNGWNYFGLKDLFYQIQRYLLAGGIFFNMLGAIILLIAGYFIYNGIKINMEEVK